MSSFDFSECEQRERTLPPVGEMERDVAAYQRWVSSRFYASPRHTTEVEYIRFMDELAVLVGCKPPLCARAT